MKRLFFAVLLLYISIPGIGQIKENLIISTYPSNLLIHLNDSIKLKGEHFRFKASEGNHNIKVWAPKFKLVDSTFYVSADKICFINIGLKPSDEYVAWRKDAYLLWGKRAGFTVGIIALSGYATSRFFAIKQNKTQMQYYKDQAMYNKFMFENSYAGLAFYEEQFNLNKSLYDKEYKKYQFNNVVIYSSAALVSGAVYTVLKYGWLKGLEPFRENVLLTNTNLNFNYSGNFSSFELSYKF